MLVQGLRLKGLKNAGLSAVTSSHMNKAALVVERTNWDTRRRVFQFVLVFSVGMEVPVPRQEDRSPIVLHFRKSIDPKREARMAYVTEEDADQQDKSGSQSGGKAEEFNKKGQKSEVKKKCPDVGEAESKKLGYHRSPPSFGSEGKISMKDVGVDNGNYVGNNAGSHISNITGSEDALKEEIKCDEEQIANECIPHANCQKPRFDLVFPVSLEEAGFRNRHLPAFFLRLFSA
jgi:hypothetical protein